VFPVHKDHIKFQGGPWSRMDKWLIRPNTQAKNAQCSQHLVQIDFAQIHPIRSSQESASNGRLALWRKPCLPPLQKKKLKEEGMETEHSQWNERVGRKKNKKPPALWNLCKLTYTTAKELWQLCASSSLRDGRYGTYSVTLDLQGQIRGITNLGGTISSVAPAGNVRCCIYVRNHIIALPLLEICSRDKTMVRMTCACGGGCKELTVASA
jgi:hypothetical protein